MDKTERKDLCQAADKIQDILIRKNLELVIWPNVQGDKCIWVIKKGGNPWEGARVATLKKDNNQ